MEIPDGIITSVFAGGQEHLEDPSRLGRGVPAGGCIGSRGAFVTEGSPSRGSSGPSRLAGCVWHCGQQSNISSVGPWTAAMRQRPAFSWDPLFNQAPTHWLGSGVPSDSLVGCRSVRVP